MGIIYNFIALYRASELDFFETNLNFIFILYHFTVKNSSHSFT